MARSTVEFSIDDEAIVPSPPVPAVPTRTVPEFWLAWKASPLTEVRLSSLATVANGIS